MLWLYSKNQKKEEEARNQTRNRRPNQHHPIKSKSSQCRTAASHLKSHLLFLHYFIHNFSPSSLAYVQHKVVQVSVIHQ